MSAPRDARHDDQEEARLLALAAAVDAGADVDWPRAEQEADSERSQRVLKGLRIIDGLARVHRSDLPPDQVDEVEEVDQGDRVDRIDPADRTDASEPFPPLLSLPPPSSARFSSRESSPRADSHAGAAADVGGATLDTRSGEALSQWGHLTLLQEIGRGAFGVVYRAWDTRLEREVALKLLPPTRAASRIQWLLREARLLARVNHDHVVTVHGAEEIDGRIGIWMESLRGRTLDVLLRVHGRFGPQEAALIGLSLCRALAAVHGAGLVHRDVKARNVMRENGGRIVLMDFGAGSDLAATRGQPIGPAGTPLYMAPEILAGAPPTPAADIYSLGVLLFHLVTETYPIVGLTKEEIETAHRRQERRRLRDIRPDLPEGFVQVVERATAPDPTHRYASAGGVEAALTSLLGAPDGAAHGDDPASRRRLWLRRAIPLALAGLVAVLGGVAAGWWRAARDETPPVRSRFEIPAPRTAAGIPMTAASVAVSPDGRHLAFVAEGQLWVRALDALDPRLLPGTGGANSPFWSPDGQHVAFFAGTKLKRVALSGDEPRTLCEARRPRGGSWSASGTILFASAGGALLQQVPADGGEPSVVRAADDARGPQELSFPHVLPDGRHYLLTLRSRDAAVQGVYVSSLDGMEPRRLLDSDSNAMYAAGALLYVRRGTLLARPFDPGRLALTGEPVSLTERVDQDAFEDGYADFSASSNGLIAYHGGQHKDRELRWFDRTGRAFSTVGKPGEYRDLALSPDGTRLAFDERDAHSGRRDVWVADLATTGVIRLTSDPDDDGAPVWSPDGRTVVFMGNRDGQFNLFAKASDGAGTETRVLNARSVPVDWSRDGRYIALETFHQKTGSDLFLLPRQPDGPPRPFLQSDFMEREPQFSPDGRWLAYSSSESSQRQIYLQRLDGTGQRRQISPGYGREPRWRADGRELFYLGPGDMLMAVPIALRADEASFEPPHELFRLRIAAADVRHHYAAAPDGQRFLVNTLLEGVRPVPLTVILNGVAR